MSRSEQRHNKLNQFQSAGHPHHQGQHQSMYYDAKPSLVESENIYERKSGSHQKFDFEKAKQKFDRSHKSMTPSTGGGPKQAKGYHGSSSASSSKRNSNNYDMNDSLLASDKLNLNDAIPYFDENVNKKGKESVYMKTSLNLDGLKVSDDEVSPKSC